MNEHSPIDHNKRPNSMVERVITKIVELSPRGIDARYTVAAVIGITGLSLQAVIIALYAAVNHK